ncbi:MAG: hypothetical protein JNL11_20105 [Bdellovibrionaceae bacterium]|nr:hypothetical protein [Pseudobdellovibrionaceae bacterium]
MIISKDEIETFLPRKTPTLLILGTMAAMCARTQNGQRPKEIFYYHNPINHFWRVLRFLFEPGNEKKLTTIEEKKEFLEKHAIAMANLVFEIQTSEENSQDPSDAILFKAYQDKNIKFKSASSALKKVIRTSPIFFTCRHKKGIDNLINGYLEHNGIELNMKNSIWYWPTPTRCSPKARAEVWRSEMILHCQQTRRHK